MLQIELESGMENALKICNVIQCKVITLAWNIVFLAISLLCSTFCYLLMYLYVKAIIILMMIIISFMIVELVCSIVSISVTGVKRWVTFRQILLCISKWN